MSRIYVLKDAQDHVQPIEEKCVVWDGEGATALSCYKDKHGTTKNMTKLVKKSRKGPYVIISGEKYYIAWDLAVEVTS